MKYFFIFSWILTITACDPTVYATYIVKNNTSKDLDIILYSNNNDTININSNDKSQLASLIDMGGKVYLSLYDKDSISINNHSNNNHIKTYLSNTAGKNIYNTDNREVWKEVKKKKRDYEYTFVITEEDIKQ